MDRLIDPMDWLRERVPLTLLMDLLDEAGPRSDELFLSEVADLGWTTGFQAA